ncbi:AF4/FMR2 family member 1 isoform X1 [Labrus mixtus]|uniref:AF4/FMR2 family member 1 isoform X1 n=1 Tax=Labrus mixtus TaxID=508554 RepID=UPI0029BFC3B5|nr:AF4/FMR2 family member 1 isoform X1 [Labrus mixtus]
MESQPSVFNEERNILRLRAWEQRNQEASQAKALNQESMPLFGQPYKTNKGDELSSKIQKMLGSYEDVNNPNPVAVEPLPIPSYVTYTQSEQGLTNTDISTQPPFHNQLCNKSNQSQRAPSSSGYSSQPTRTSTAFSPNNCGHLSTLSAHRQKNSEAHSDRREQEISSLCPDPKQLPFLRASDLENTDMDTKDTFDRHQLQKSTNDPTESGCTVEVSTFNLKQSPKDAPQPQGNKGNALPSQTFPSLLSSKQPCVVMTQKPTAYVRPMDGQDQVVSESPELKPSPEPYVPLPEFISKSEQGKGKILPQFLETSINEAQCVEDILKEMTHSWPPLLTAIHTPGTGEPSKSPFQTKEAERVSSCPGQKNYNSSTDPSQPTQQSSSSSLQAAHSRRVESASSSDSESSSRSESDSESATEEPPRPPVSNSVKSEPDAPAVTHVDWQLGNWIRSSHGSRSENQSVAQASDSPPHKPPRPAQSTNHSVVEVVDPTRESKPQVSSHQKESTDSLGKLQVCRESPQDNYNQQSSQKSPSADRKSCSRLRKLSCNPHSSKSAKAGCPEVTLGLKCEDVVATRDKDPCFTDRPKVKTKTGHGRKSKDGSVAKGDDKRTSKHKLLDKQKVESEPDVKLVLHGQCPSCRVRFPNPCSCPTQSLAQPDQLSPAPSVKINCSKPKTETICQKGAKTPHKTTPKHLGKTGHTAKSTQDPHRPPRSLLVRIDLSLLSRVPQSSGGHQETGCKSKRSVVVVEQDGRGGDAATIHKLSKTSKKSIPQNVEVEIKTVPRKKQRLENQNTSSSHLPDKMDSSSISTEGLERKKAKKNPLQQPGKPKDSEKDSKLHNRLTEGAQESSKKAVDGKDSRKNKRRSGKPTECPQLEKQKLPKSGAASSSQSTREALTPRPLLRLEDRQYPVKHYIKEAKKLKHKADAESDKLNKAFIYLEAAMFFVESGIAMEKDPQISTSSYTMFAETVELLKFVLKLKNPVDPSAPPPEKDFLALCLKCQSLLQMAMFHHKQKTALKYSKTLSDHFNISAQKTHDPSFSTSKSSDTPSPMPNLPSPANTSSSSGPGSNHSGSGLVVDAIGSTVAFPQAIERVAFNYVNITTLFLSAHDIWEQAEELAHKGSGLLTELDTVIGPLSLTSSMSSMVRYTRQGVHWLRLDSLKVK